MNDPNHSILMSSPLVTYVHGPAEAFQALDRPVTQAGPYFSIAFLYFFLLFRIFFYPFLDTSIPN